MVLVQASTRKEMQQQTETGPCATSQQEKAGLWLGYRRTLCHAHIALRDHDTLSPSPAQVARDTQGPSQGLTGTGTYSLS